MITKGLSILVAMLCLGLIISGCPKKTSVKEDPSVMSAEELEAQKEKEAKKAEKIRQEEAEKIRQEEAERIRQEEAKAELAKKEFEQSLVAKRTPGIEGVIHESKMLRDIHFDFDRYDIRVGDAEVLRQNSALLMKYPAMKFQIEGHCDERGTTEYNLALGERRAHSVRKFLVSLGIEPTRISTISYGEERPLEQEQCEEAWAKNRRAHFVILSR